MINGYVGSEDALVGHLSSLLAAAKDRAAASVSKTDDVRMSGAGNKMANNMYRAGVEALVKEGEQIRVNVGCREG